MNYNEFLEKTTSFVCESEVHRNVKECYDDIYDFFHSCSIVNSLYVFSGLAKEEKGQTISTKYFRKVWFSKSIENDGLTKIKNALKKTIEEDEDLFKDNHYGENEYGIVFPIGVVGSQIHMATLSLNSKADKQILLKTVEILKGALKRHRVWQRVSELEKLVDTDDVTGLFNQRRLFRELDVAINRYKKTNESFCVLFIDIDHFKNVNDGHGHLVGTKLLHDMGGVLQKLLRENDYCFRYGGDEFVVLLKDIGHESATKIGERILNEVKGHDFEFDDKIHDKKIYKFKLSVSIGVACYPNDAKSKEDILSIADKFMYEAKQSGRGKVCFAGQMIKGD